MNNHGKTSAKSKLNSVLNLISFLKKNGTFDRHLTRKEVNGGVVLEQLLLEYTNIINLVCDKFKRKYRHK